MINPLYDSIDKLQAKVKSLEALNKELYEALKTIQRTKMLKLASNFTECGVLEMVEETLAKYEGKE